MPLTSSITVDNQSVTEIESTRQKYYITQETPSLLRRIVIATGTPLSSKVAACLQELADDYRVQMVNLLSEALPDIEIEFCTEEEINLALFKKIEFELMQNPEREVVCLDRFLLSDVTEFVVRRLEITRLSDGNKDARTGCPDIEQQLQNLETEIGQRKIILVDDGLFTGGSVVDAIQLLKNKGLSVEKIISFVRDAKRTKDELEGVPVDACVLMRNFKDWLDFRDFLTLCGRTEPKDEALPYQTTRYYLAPTDDGSKASLDQLNRADFITLSKNALKVEEELLEELERNIINNRLTIEAVTKAGFAVSRFPNVPLPSFSESYRNYIAKPRKILEAMLLPKPERIILDMDGTLYPLDGKSDGFLDSTLEREIESNALLFIINRESCSPNEAIALFSEAKRDPVGASKFFAQKYGISREEYFTETWGRVDASLVLKEDVAVQRILDELCQKGIAMTLLTSAPRAWFEKVMQMLGIDFEKAFDDIITAENFEKKQQIFREKAKESNGEVIFSVGDTYESDIEAAEKYGIIGFYVNSINPFSNILYAGTAYEQ